MIVSSLSLFVEYIYVLLAWEPGFAWKLNYGYESRLAQLKICKISSEHSRGSTEFPQLKLLVNQSGIMTVHRQI